MVQALQAGGLSLKQCLACLAGELEQATLKPGSGSWMKSWRGCNAPRDLLADLAGLRAHSGDEFKAWQRQLQHQAPQAYFAWVMKQGIQ